MNTRVLLGLTLSLAMVAAARAAPAAPMSDTDTPSDAVRTSDLDLSQPDGAKALLSRLRHAASVACGGRPTGTGDLGAMQAYTACYHGPPGRSRRPGARTPGRRPLSLGHDQNMASDGGPRGAVDPRPVR